jgi:hypothetical protein
LIRLKLRSIRNILLHSISGNSGSRGKGYKFFSLAFQEGISK